MAVCPDPRAPATVRCEVLCAKCLPGNPAGAAICRCCAAELAVSPEAKAAADNKKKAAEVVALKAQIAAKKAAADQAKAEADAAATTDAELEQLRAEVAAFNEPAAAGA